MGLLEVASGKSIWRGYDYYKESKVKTKHKIAADLYEGTVEGSEGNLYQVTIDIEHPKRSVCTCPHAEVSRRVCKHKVALYFSIFPEEADRIVREAEEWEAEEEKRQEAERAEIKKYVYSLTKQELREQLLWRMMEEWEERERKYYY